MKKKGYKFRLNNARSDKVVVLPTAYTARSQNMTRFFSGAMKRGLKYKSEQIFFNASLRLSRSRVKVTGFELLQKLLEKANPVVCVNSQSFIRNKKVTTKTYSLDVCFSPRRLSGLAARFAVEVLFDKTLKKNASLKYSDLISNLYGQFGTVPFNWAHTAQRNYFSVLAENFKSKRQPWMRKLLGIDTKSKKSR